MTDNISENQDDPLITVEAVDRDEIAVRGNKSASSSINKQG